MTVGPRGCAVGFEKQLAVEVCVGLVGSSALVSCWAVAGDQASGLVIASLAASHQVDPGSAVER